jgi:molybdate transport system regulatory protein
MAGTGNHSSAERSRHDEASMIDAKPKVVAFRERQPGGRDGAVSRARPRLRIVFAEAMRLGPGKIDLLDAIGRKGSISAAGRDLGMSYRRAWLLVDEVNRMFRRPVVVAVAGGAHGGGAQLTDFGRALIAAYRRIEDRTRIAIREELAPFESDLTDDDDHTP